MMVKVPPVKVHKDGDRIIIWQVRDACYNAVVLDRLVVGNLVQELDAWMSGTDQFPEHDG